MLLLPHKMDRYTLLLPLGTGGMGSVYLANMTGIGGFGRDVAIKCLHPHLQSDSDFVDAFLREARLSANIRHPNVVPVLDVNRGDLGVFLVMEYVQGVSLAELRKAAAGRKIVLNRSVAMRALIDALQGLHAAHEAVGEDGKNLGLVHRDFSPHNILVGVDGRTRLLDFGVAKVARSSMRTESGVIKGKLPYMAPEQARGAGVDRRTDVWAAGVVAWELLAGRRMHKSRNESEVLLAIVNDEVPPLAQCAPDLPAAVYDAVDWALTRDPAARCPDAETFGERLVEALKPEPGVASEQEVVDCVRQLCGRALEDVAAAVKDARAAAHGAGAGIGLVYSQAAMSTTRPREDGRQADALAATMDLRPRVEKENVRWAVWKWFAVAALVAASVAIVVARASAPETIEPLTPPSPALIEPSALEKDNVNRRAPADKGGTAQWKTAKKHPSTKVNPPKAGARNQAPKGADSKRGSQEKPAGRDDLLPPNLDNKRPTLLDNPY